MSFDTDLRLRVPSRQYPRCIAIAPQSDAQLRQVARRFEIIQSKLEF
jgi:hypothetical protein